MSRIDAGLLNVTHSHTNQTGDSNKRAFRNLSNEAQLGSELGSELGLELGLEELQSMALSSSPERAETPSSAFSNSEAQNGGFSSKDHGRVPTPQEAIPIEALLGELQGTLNPSSPSLNPSSPSLKLCFTQP